MKSAASPKKSFSGKKGIFALAFACAAFAASTSFASTITLQWDPVTAPDVAGYKVYYGNSSAAPLTGTGATQGASPVNAVSTTATITGLDPGQPYYFAVTAYNTAGVESPYSNIVAVPELVPPAVSFASPASNAQASGIVSVTANATDNVGVARVEFYVNGVLKATDTSAPYYYSWDTSTVASGTYTLLAKAYDAAGNVGTSNLAVNVVHDVTAPITSVTAPASGAVLRGVVSITAAATDDVGITKVEFYANGSLLSASNVPPYGYNWNTSAVGNGAYTLTSKAYDAAGNVGESAAVQVTVLNDSIAPSVAIAQPVAGATVGGANATVTANASDNIGVEKVEFFLNGALKATVAAAPFGFTLDTSSLSNGLYTLTAKAYDAAGNVGESAAVQVTIFNDHDAPVVALQQPTADNVVKGQVQLSASATDNVAVARVEFYVDGLLVSTAASAPYIMAWDTTEDANGTYRISARAIDAAGNVGQATELSLQVANDVTAPVLSVDPLSGRTTTGGRMVSGQVTDNVAVARVVVQVGEGTPVEAVITGSTWTCAAVDLATGVNRVVVTATDAAGNSSQVRLNLKRY